MLKSHSTFYILLQLGPNVTVGKNCVLGEGVRVRESLVLEGAVLQVCMLTNKGVNVKGF